MPVVAAHIAAMPATRRSKVRSFHTAPSPSWPVLLLPHAQTVRGHDHTHPLVIDIGLSQATWIDRIITRLSDYAGEPRVGAGVNA